MSSPATGPEVAIALPDADPYDARRSTAGEGIVRLFSEATVLGAADVRAALALSRVAGGAEPSVQLAVALAVRAVRLGHVYVDLATVARTAALEDEAVEVDLADLPWPDPAGWPTAVAGSSLTALGPDGPPDRPLRLLGTHLYLDRYWRHERAIVEDLLARSTGPGPAVDAAALAAGLADLFGADPAGAGPGGPGSDLQRVAAATAVLRHLTVVAGGPGTGKTTTVARILALLHGQAAALGQPPPHVALVAPTGKAAARLAEAVHGEATALPVEATVRAALLATPASTLHRLLGWQPGNRSRFRHDATNQLPHTVVIVDESSMVSLSMMARLLAAVRPSTRLVLVGDPRQLASVEAGAVLGDIVGRAADGLALRPAARQAVEAAVGGPVEAVDPGPDASIADGTVVLRRIHRFGGTVATLATAIERGDADAVVAVLRSEADDVRWIEPEGALDPTEAPQLDAVRRSVLRAARAVVAAARGGRSAEALDALGSVQVLCAHRRGPFGAAAWRAEIERWLRTAIEGYGTGPWYPGRPLLVTENDYGINVFNGDTGVVVDTGGGRLRAVFDRRGEVLEVRPTRLASVDSLYAMTIHKAQGSQFGEVVVVLPESSPVLTRELLYTGVTRARDRVTLVATEASVRAAVERPVARASGLAEALWGSGPAGADGPERVI